MILKKLGIVGCALLALGSGACREIEPDANPPQEALEGVPVLPLSTVLFEGGTNEVAQTVLFAPNAIDTTATWYREYLIEEGWDLVSDVTDPNGRVTLHAVRDGPPLWVILEREPTQYGTRYTIMGALPDSDQLQQARDRTTAD
jgi:hypothetical protein